MTICYVQGNTVIHVGEWDFQEVPSAVDDKTRPIFSVVDDYTKPIFGDDEAVLGYEQKLGEVFCYEQKPGPSVITNPIPDGAERVDVPIGWTDGGQIVLASDARCVRAFE